MTGNWLLDFNERTSATLRWVAHSVQATDGQGSAAYYHLWKGWSSAYPETTGYLIETLFDYARYFENESYKNLAIQCADWLCRIQRSDGAFPGGLGIHGEPIIFDTGQILFGIVRAFQETQEVKYRIAAKKAVNWLLQQLESDGSWQRFGYIPGYVPSYYTRVVWAVLFTNQIIQEEYINAKMKFALNYYMNKITKEFSVENWSFEPNAPAFTHTIAYTYRGMLESAYLLKETAHLEKIQLCLNQLLTLYKDKYAGSYHINWEGNNTFSCVTGDAQISLLFARAYQIIGTPAYLDHSQTVFEQVASRQCTLRVPGFYGGIPGAAPMWGTYQRFKFINWAAKFYLDAYLILHQLISK